MAFWSKAELTVDTVSDFFGKIGWVIIMYAMIFGLIDVALRYIFQAPSMWISLTIQYSMVLLACVSGPYALNNGEFVKLDVFYENFTDRKKALVDILTFVLTFLYLYVLIVKGFEYALNSLGRREVTPTSIAIPLYHLKFMIPIAATFTMVVALRKFINDVYTLVTGKSRKQYVKNEE